MSDNQQGRNTSSSSQGGQSQQTNLGGAGSTGGSQDTTTQNNGGQQQQSQAPVRPDAFSDKSYDRFWDDKTGVKYGDLATEFQNLTAFKAQEDLRKLSLPQKPEDYKIELPNGFQVPEGVKFDGFDESDPRIEAARKFAQETGIDQAGFSRLLGIHAAHEFAQVIEINNARKAEVEKLGMNGPARVDAVRTFLATRLGSERGGALLDRLVLASDLQAMEDLVQQYSSQGTASFNGSHREQRTDAVTDEQYDKMSPRQKLDYARRAGAGSR